MMNNLLQFTTLEIVMMIALLLPFVIQLVYHFNLYRGISRHCHDEQVGNLPYQKEYLPISVIIIARDDADDLEKFLPLVLEQDYPDFEVIVVNDGATDECNDLLKRIEMKYGNLYHTFTPNDAHHVCYMKLSITVGIKAAKHEWLVFTEPNCHPVSNQWLRLMARNFTDSTELVLGYSTFHHGEAMWQHKVKYYNFFNQLRYLSFALKDKTYMGCGRNLAYRKSVFFNNKGFSSHLNLNAGYDDIFVNEVATPFNTRVELNPESVVMMEAYETESRWREERSNYRSTCRLYKGKQRFWLGLETCTRILFLLLAFCVIIYSAIVQQWVLLGFAALLYILYYVSHIIIFDGAAAALGEPKHYLSYLRRDFQQLFVTIKERIIYSSSEKSEYDR